jgi:hypothetical protein
VGINDAACGSDHGHNLEKLFEAQETLYDSGQYDPLSYSSPVNHSQAHETSFS